MKCDKCGNIILPEWRFCYSCGAMINNEEETLSLQEDTNNINKMPIYISNLIIFIINTIFIILFYLLFKNNFVSLLKQLVTKMKVTIPYNYNTIILIIFIIIFILNIIYRFYSMVYQIILKKASMYWWLMLIPGINYIYMGISKFKLAYGNYGFFLIYLILSLVTSFLIIPFKSNTNIFNIINLIITIISFIINIMLECKMAKNFNASKILTVFFAPIMYPIIAFSKKYEYFCDN